MKSKLRRIKINEYTYLWKRKHYHLTEFKHSKCVEKVTIYLQGFKKSPLQLLFREEDNLTLKTNLKKEKWYVGHPDDGVVWLYKCNSPISSNQPCPIEQRQTIVINLNRPAVIAELIKYFTLNGWKPKEMTKPFVKENALKFLEIIELPQGNN